MAASTPEEERLASLRRHHALNTRPEAVRDPLFSAGDPFFDARDLVQVKYEMLRSVRQDGRPASQAARAFGFSRPSFYGARALYEAGGLPALVPQRPGPRRAHKLSEAVVDRLERMRTEEPGAGARRLAERIEEELGLRVHPRSIERALARRRRKKGLR